MSRGDLWRAAAMAALGALFLGGIAILNRRPEATAVIEAAPAAAMPDDLSTDLRRCAGLGQSQTGDARCTGVWEENRRRFFGRPARPIAPTAVPVTDAVSPPMPAENQGAAR